LKVAKAFPGAGSKPTAAAAFRIFHFPVSAEVQRSAIPAIGNQLDQALLRHDAAGRDAVIRRVCPAGGAAGWIATDLQRQVVVRMVNTEELWSIGNLLWTFQAYGLPHDRENCAQLAGVKVTSDEALKALSTGVIFAEMNFLEKAREHILQALELDPIVLERAPAPDECWLFCAKAFAETDPERAIAAFQRAASLNPASAYRVNPAWRLADLLKERGLG
jgi:tetratricopeptide (TPR) repeat protein